MDKETIKRGKITLIATNVTPNRFFYPMIRPIYDYFVLKSQELKTRSDQIMDGLFSTKVPEEIYPKSRLDWTGYLPGFRMPGRSDKHRCKVAYTAAGYYVITMRKMLNSPIL